jgi:hypothetical protein
MSFKDGDKRMAFSLGFSQNPRHDFGVFSKGSRMAAHALAQELLRKGGERPFLKLQTKGYTPLSTDPMKRERLIPDNSETPNPRSPAAHGCGGC